MAECEEAHPGFELRAAPPEELLPCEIDDEARQLRRARGDDDAAFVEESERVALGAAAPGLVLAALFEDRRVLGVDRRLRVGKADPDERVEEVVPVFRASLDLAGLCDAQLVVAAFAVRMSAQGDELERLPP